MSIYFIISKSWEWVWEDLGNKFWKLFHCLFLLKHIDEINKGAKTGFYLDVVPSTELNQILRLKVFYKRF